MRNTNNEARAFALGRSRFGGGPAQLLLLMLGSSLLLAVVLSAVLNLIVEFDEGFWPAWINLTVCFWLIGTLGAWFVFVDRQSLPKVAKNPAQTIEQSWRSRAQAKVFRDLLVLFVLGSLASTVVSLGADSAPTWQVALVCAGLTWFTLMDYLIRYQLIKRAES